MNAPTRKLTEYVVEITSTSPRYAVASNGVSGYVVVEEMHAAWTRVATTKTKAQAMEFIAEKTNTNI
jgi:hypothetical protein